MARRCCAAQGCRTMPPHAIDFRPGCWQYSKICWRRSLRATIRASGRLMVGGASRPRKVPARRSQRKPEHREMTNLFASASVGVSTARRSLLRPRESSAQPRSNRNCQECRDRGGQILLPGAAMLIPRETNSRSWVTRVTKGGLLKLVPKGFQ